MRQPPRPPGLAHVQRSPAILVPKAQYAGVGEFIFSMVYRPLTSLIGTGVTSTRMSRCWCAVSEARARFNVDLAWMT